MRSPSSPFESDEELNLIDLEPAPFDASEDNHSAMDFNSIATPERCIADFCLIPIGTPTASVSNEVAVVQRLMKSSGLEYAMHSAGTTLEGSWDQVMETIGKAHSLVHKNGVVRVQTDIRAGTRTDKVQHFHEKVSKVESILANDSAPKKNLFTSFIPTASVSPNTSQVSSYSARVPWISASMHLRRSFVPHNDGTTEENALASKSSEKPGTLGLIWDLKFDVNNVLTWLMAAYFLKGILSFTVFSARGLDPRDFHELPAIRRPSKSWWGS